jgi:hypothetical protein
LIELELANGAGMAAARGPHPCFESDAFLTRDSAQERVQELLVRPILDKEIDDHGLNHREALEA